MREGEQAPVTEAAFEPVGDPRDERPQYVMPLVVRLERDAPPQRTDALETAARAVLTLLADPREAPPWWWTPTLLDRKVQLESGV